MNDNYKTKAQLIEELKALRAGAGIVSDLAERKKADEALKETSERLALALSGGDLGLWDWDPQSGGVVYSESWARMLGYEPDEVEPTVDFFKNHVHPEDLPSVLQELNGHLEGRLPVYDSVHRVYTKTGKCLWIHDRGKIVKRDSDNRPVRVSGVISDITERKQAEVYREVGREILQILNEPVDLHVSIQRILAALKTRTGTDAVGLRLQDGEDFPYFAEDGFPPDFLKVENTLVERGRDGGVCRDKGGNVCLECTCGLVISGKTDPSNPLFTQGGSCWTNDSLPLLDLPSDQDPRRHARNNCIHQGYASVALIPIRSSDRIVGLLQLNDKRKGRFTLETIEILEGIAGHIGSALLRKKAEAELEESKRFLCTILDAIPHHIWWKDNDNRFMGVNAKTVQSLGLSSPEEVVGKTDYDLFPKDDADHYIADDTEVRESGEPKLGIEEVVILTGNDLHWQETNKVPLRNHDGKIIGTVGTATDITERKQAEERENVLREKLSRAKRMESLGVLAGGVAHDLNNILGPLVLLPEMLAEDLADPENLDFEEALEMVEQIKSSADRSRSVVKDLLSLGRRGRCNLVQMDVSQVQCVSDECHVAKEIKQSRGNIRFFFNTGEESLFILGDSDQISRAVGNLVRNAAEAIPDKGDVSVRTFKKHLSHDHLGYERIPQGNYAVIEVADTGSGIPKENIDRIFEPFYSKKEKTGKSGTGLGLSVVNGIVKDHNGFIDVHSEEGKGTVFSVYLPLLSKRETGRVDPEFSHAVGGNEKILIVDDEPGQRFLCRKSLRRLGYGTEEAKNGHQAVALFEKAKKAGEESPYDLIVMDMVMEEGFDGLDAYKAILKLYPDQKIIIASGHAENDRAKEAVDLGAQWLAKPYQKTDLARSVRERLERG